MQWQLQESSGRCDSSGSSGSDSGDGGNSCSGSSRTAVVGMTVAAEVVAELVVMAAADGYL